MNEDKNTKYGYFAALTGFRRAVPIILGALAVFIAVCFFTSDTGMLGAGVTSVLRGLFSAGAYAIPAVLALHAFFYAEDHAKGLTLSRSIFSAITVLIVSGIDYTVVFWDKALVFAPVEFYVNQTAGGFIGSIVAFLITTVLGNIGLYILSGAILAIYITFFFTRGDSAFSKTVLSFVELLARGLAAIERKILGVHKSIKDAKEEREREEEERRSAELLDDQFFAVDNGMKELKIKELGIHESMQSEPSEFNPTLSESVNHNSVLTPELQALPEYREEEPAPIEKEAHIHIKKNVDLSYGLDDGYLLPAAEDIGESEISTDTVAEATVVEEEKKEEKKATAASFGIDESADSVFSSATFDPFDFAAAEKLSSKLSSKVQPRVISKGISEISTPLSSITEDDVLKLQREKENQRRIAEFEERKRQITGRSAAESAAAPQAPASEIIKAEENKISEPATTESIATREYTPKTVEYSVSTEKAAPAPMISSSMTMVFEKPDFVDDEAEAAAAKIAELVERNVPGYTRSANKSYTYIKVTVPEEEKPAEQETDISANNEDAISAYAEVKEEPAIATASAPEAPVYAEVKEEPATVTASAPEAPVYAEVKEEPAIATASAPEASAYAEIKEEPAIATASAPEAPVHADIKEESATVAASAPEAPVYAEVKEEPAIATASAPEAPVYAEVKEEPSAISSYAAAAPQGEVHYTKVINEYNTAKESEAENTQAEEFKPYVAPSIDGSATPEKAEEDTLRIERTMLAPSPSSIYDAVTEARDRKYTVIDADMPVFENKPEELEVPEDTIEWSTEPTSESASDSLPIEESGEATVFDFGDGDFGSEEEPIYETDSNDGDATMIFAQDDAADEEGEEVEENEVAAIFETPEEELDGNEAIPPEKQNPEVLKQREMFPILDRDEPEEAIPTAEGKNDGEEILIEEPEAEAEIIEEIPDEEEMISDNSEDIDDELDYHDLTAEEDDVPFDLDEDYSPIKDITEPLKKEPPKPKKPDFSNYEFPPIEILGLDENRVDLSIQEEIQETADKLIETLASFDVTASIKGVDRGPRITRYEVVPAKGVRSSRVLGLQDDIALNLAAESIRMEAPIPGKSAVGVEIPNKKPSTVRLRELIETEDFKNSRSKTTVCIGKDVAGQPIFADIAKMPHVLIAGATGMGKSVCINSLMISMLYKARPDEVKFIMIDPKQVEFTMYNGIPHLLVPIVNDVKQAAGTLMWAVEEMERRYGLLQQLCVRHIDGYNEKVAADPSLGDPLPRIVIVIDEFAELIMQVKNPVESLVIRIAQKARAAGIHLIIGTQKPVKEVITGLIKSNIPTKFSCKVSSNRDAILIFDQSGAEKLLDKGDMLIAFANSPKPQRVQCAFVADDEVEQIMEHLKKFSNGDCYDESVMEDIKRAADKCNKKGSGGDYDDDDEDGAGEGYLNDKQFLDAVDVAVKSSKISTSLLQRRLSIGYGKAAKFIDIMCDMGIVSEPNGQKPRDVLISADEWREKLSRTMID